MGIAVVTVALAAGDEMPLRGVVTVSLEWAMFFAHYQPDQMYNLVPRKIAMLLRPSLQRSVGYALNRRSHRAGLTNGNFWHAPPWQQIAHRHDFFPRNGGCLPAAYHAEQRARALPPAKTFAAKKPGQHLNFQLT